MDDAKIRIAEYLSVLNPSICEDYCKDHDIDIEKVSPVIFDTAESVLMGMSEFSNLGVSLRHFFDNPTVWGLYLRSIMEDRFHAGVSLILQVGTHLDLIYFFDACYRFGFPAVSDADYDAIITLYSQVYSDMKEHDEKTYDDLSFSALILDALKLCKVKSEGKKVSKLSLTGNALYDDLNAEKSTSIRPVVSTEEAFEFWRNAPLCKVHFSLKIDGVNTKGAFSSDSDKGLEVAISRGRATNSIDYTEAIRRMVSIKNIDDRALSGRVVGESFVGTDDLKILQAHYPDKDYKSPKSAAMAMLRAPDKFMVEDYKLLSFRAFSYGDRPPDVAYHLLQVAGLDVPPYQIFDGEDIPRDSLEHFNEWMLENVLNPMWKSGEELGIGSDGVVMHLLADIYTERKDKYSDSNIAIKYGPWSAASYFSKVTGIIFEQRRVEASIVLQVEPTLMRDKNTATRVGIGSPDILINDDVRIGDTIEFERKSEAYNVYLRKKFDGEAHN